MTPCTDVPCQKTYEVGECHRKRAVSFVDFVWRRGVPSCGGGVRGLRGVWDEAVTGVSNAAERGTVVRLLEPVQHEDVAEGPQADTPQEAPFRCQVDNNSDDGRDNRRPPLRACRARVIAERR